MPFDVNHRPRLFIEGRQQCRATPAHPRPHVPDLPAEDDAPQAPDVHVTGRTLHPGAAGAGDTNLLQRILLVTDGTVTNILEAYSGEPIRVVKLHQSVERSAGVIADLELYSDQEVMRREVLLQGSGSGTTLVHALSLIVPARLSPALRAGLLESNKPIGRLLEETRAETFREILGSWREPAGSRAHHFGIDRDAPVITRTYRVLGGGRPVMLITERFPADSFELHPEHVARPAARRSADV